MPTFKQYHKNNVLIGTGTYKFRPYTVLSPTVSLTATLTGCTMSPTVTTINRLGQSTLTFMASTNYRLPTSVQVTGATAVSWDQNTGKLVIEKPTADTVNVKVVATKVTYTITTNLTNVTKSSGPSSIEAGGTATLVFAAADNYELPDSVTVAGATSNWTQSTGTLSLSNATGNVTVTIAGVYLLKVIAAGTYTLKDEPSVTATHAQFAFTTNNVAGSGIAVDSTGITYTLASPMGATKVYTAATKAWTLASYKTIVLSAEAHVSEVFNTWWTANLVEKLATPTNVTADGTVLSWDAVENAESYDIYAGETLIGNTDGGGGVTSETWVLNEIPSSSIEYDSIPFISNERQFLVLSCSIIRIYYSSTKVYDGGWLDEAYRTITFATAPTGDLLTWLQDNAVKQ